jgi:hypothetical protein
MIKSRIAAAIVAALFAHAALAETAAVTIEPRAAAAVSVSGKLQVIITSVPLLGFNPPNPSVPCSIPAGTPISAVAVTGGNGNPITLGISDPTSSFVLDGTTPPANVIPGPNGLAAAACPAAGAPSITDIVTITATQ